MTPATRTGWLGWLGFALALAVAGFAFRTPLSAWFRTPGAPASSATTNHVATDAAIDHYTCSMHPSVKAAVPGKCPICGMELIPITKEQEAEGIVLIDGARRQLSGVRTEPVTVGPMTSVFSATGRVAYDESSLSEVNLKVRGWITKLAANETGQRVKRGQTLFWLYSPDLYAAEQDFLLANRGASALGSAADAAPHSDAVASAARKRLELLGLSAAQVDAVAAQGEPLESIAVPAPASGFVIEKNVVEGAAVEAGMRLYRIAALDRVWIETDVYEQDLARVHVGTLAEVTLDYLPERKYEAKVAYIYPYLDPNARTARLRLELANKQLELRPGMYARVELTGDLGAHVQVPSSAVVYTGPRRLVFLDLGDGRFRAREIRIGAESNGMIEVLEGLEAGDVVATSGVFLI
ncbi:MAG TPA: efflux RND transporter periplasmic adaptor subunit, partial [Polyangiaceae bacterium]|nr:efflux RND transporter periplasmic adaptor subunit [Polyangiaceae bacterium]